MRILFVATEMSPFFKLGGLGDVIGALPESISKVGHQVDVVLPAYQGINFQGLDRQEILELKFQFDDREVDCRVIQTRFNSVNVYFISNLEAIDTYNKIAFAGDQKEVDHYAFFSRAVIEFILKATNNYEVVHLHDWHVGLIPRLYRLVSQEYRESLSQPRFVFTIHNLGYHGYSEPDLVGRLNLRMIDQAHQDAYFEFDEQDDHQLDLLLQGILSSDLVTTVSPHYRDQILTPEYCEGLCDVLQIRSRELVGVLNGLDYDVWDPATDGSLSRNYHFNDRADLPSVLEGKFVNKVEMLNDLGLDEAELPLVSFIGRLDPDQKGLQLLLDFLQISLADSQTKFNFVLLGEGKNEWEQSFLSFAKPHTDRVRVQIEFNEILARRLYASSDLILIPSLYEPCGLVQMIAMRYGALPLVRKTGGLADTVIDDVDGFVFEDYSVDSFLGTFSRAMLMINDQPTKWGAMISSAMDKRFLWSSAAAEYSKLYQKLIGDRELLTVSP